MMESFCAKIRVIVVLCVSCAVRVQNDVWKFISGRRLGRETPCVGGVCLLKAFICFGARFEESGVSARRNREKLRRWGAWGLGRQLALLTGADGNAVRDGIKRARNTGMLARRWWAEGHCSPMSPALMAAL